jgi:cytochrome P450
MPLTRFCPVTKRRVDGLPPSAPFPAMLQTLACRWSPFGYLEWCRERLGDSFTVYPINMPPLVFLSNPRDIRTVTTAPADILHPGAGGAIMKPIFGEGAFVLREEAEHLTGRTAVMPALHRRVVQEHSEAIATQIGSEVASWPTETIFALDQGLRSLTLKILLKVVLHTDDTTHETLRHRMLAMLSVMPSPVLQEPWLRHLPGWHSTWRMFTKQRQGVHDLISALIIERRRNNTHHGDMLDALIAARTPDGLPLADDEVRDSFASVLIAGHETTAAQLGWAFQLLAHNPIIQHRLAAEIDHGACNEYMTATIQETMRHGPVFLFTPPRAVAKPIKIGGRIYLPPAQLAGCIYLMHHDPRLHPDPHTFRPERFLGQHAHPATFLPWGAGRKHCPGRHLALAVMQSILHHVLATRHVRPASLRVESPRWRSAILAPQAGCRVVLERRRPPSASPTRPAKRCIRSLSSADPVDRPPSASD